ncbi:bifunctional lysylphosphatidylglycerol flippase/synthetase MprF [Arthrobacter alpinus]|nr:DUF2156 domain-containing protein [Arthrobacter alpinus]
MRYLAWIRRAPFSTALIVAIVVAHGLSGAFLSRLPRTVAGTWGYQSTDLLSDKWWNMFTTLFLSSNTGSMLLGVGVVGAAVGIAEFTLGSLRTAAFFCATQVAAVVLYAAVLALGNLGGIEWTAGMDQATLLGPFAAAAGTLLAASQGISLLWRRRVRVLVLAVSLMLSVYVGHAQHVFILLAGVAGLTLGLAFVTALGHRGAGRSTSREVRTILAMVVAVFAVGPLAAALAHVAVGPLAVMRTWITNQEPTLAQWQGSCHDLNAACQGMAHNLGMLGSGGHLLALMPMVLLLVCAEGLRRGSRLAMWVAVYLHVVIGLVSAAYFQVFAGLGLSLRRGHRSLNINESVWELLPVVLVPVLIAVALLIFRRHFRVDPDPALRRRAISLLPLLLLAVVGLYTLAWLSEGNLANHLGVVALVAGIPRIVLPYPFPFSYAANVYPHGFFSELLFSFGGLLLWLVSAAIILALFLSRRLHSGATDATKALELVRKGGDSLSWMTLWANNQYWFNAAGTVGVAYQPHNGVAVTVGGPIGEPGDYDGAVDEFLDFCTDESLTACFYSVTDTPATMLERRGFRRIQVAAETLLDVRSMGFKGKDWQNVRTALNKATKLGVTALWCSYGELTSGQRTQVHEISEDWVSGQALPELGFTLGGLEELKHENVQLCLAIDESGRIHAVTSWLPVYSEGEIVSWTLDFMRRNSGAFNGVMEYLIAQAVQHFAATVEYISLSGSPLATTSETGVTGVSGQESSGQENTLGRILALLARTLEPVYGFSSLANFKQRFKPRHRSLYLMYQDPLSLPAIGRAVGEAYMPNVSVRSLARLLRKQ